MGFYADFWKNFVNFSGKTGLKDYWLTFLVNIVVSHSWKNQSECSLYFFLGYFNSILGNQCASSA